MGAQECQTLSCRSIVISFEVGSRPSPAQAGAFGRATLVAIRVCVPIRQLSFLFRKHYWHSFEIIDTMNKAKAMLHALMGPSRDLAPSDKKEDWRDRKVCKAFLVAFCPYEKSMLGGRRNFEVCDRIHNEMLKVEFNKHADGAPDSSFRRECEE